MERVYGLTHSWSGRYAPWNLTGVVSILIKQRERLY